MLQHASRLIALLFLTALTSAGGLVHAAHPDDPPARVARLSFVAGDVSFAPAGEVDWLRAVPNRPLIRGDQVWTDRRGRAELQMGAVALRMDEHTALALLDLTDRFGQFELNAGRINLYVDAAAAGQSFEIATPALALAIDRPGSYTIEVSQDGRYTEVQIWQGLAEAFGDRARFELREGDAVRFHDRQLRDFDFLPLRTDEFHHFAFARDDRLRRSPSLRYVSSDVIGYDDLDRYGRWQEVRDYGGVWFPSSVRSDWAPYRHGHWIWQNPWGWTWVDDAPWGFAPFHYGRWVMVGGRWGWLPAPPRSRAVYAPALVAFLGGDRWSVSLSLRSEPVGWFPLGPRDVYVPWYRVSRDYFTQVNLGPTVFTPSYVSTAYQRYYVEERGLPQGEYAYRRTPAAVTVVTRDTFARSQPVQQARLQVDPEAITRAEVRRLARVEPTPRSLAGPTSPSQARPRAELLQREVLARRAPPAAAFESRFASTRGDAERGRERAAVESRRAGVDSSRRSQVRVLDAAAAGQIDRRSERGRGEPRQAIVREQPGRVVRTVPPSSEAGRLREPAERIQRGDVDRTAQGRGEPSADPRRRVESGVERVDRRVEERRAERRLQTPPPAVVRRASSGEVVDPSPTSRAATGRAAAAAGAQRLESGVRQAAPATRERRGQPQAERGQSARQAARPADARESARLQREAAIEEQRADPRSERLEQRRERRDERRRDREDGRQP